VTEPPDHPIRYHVSYSGRVREELKALVARARALGLGPQVIAAVKEIDRLLHIYPQFGQPLRDLSFEPAQLWIGVVEPLTVRYVLDEERHAVMVVVPFLPLPSSGL
jgi:hypothetical protein